MKKILLAVTLIALVGCGKSKNGAEGQTVYIPAPAAPSEPADSVQDDIDHMVSLKNEFRALNGQNPLVKNLMCQLKTITGGSTFGSAAPFTGAAHVAYFEYNGPFEQLASNISAGMNVLPAVFKALYKNMYTFTCSGFIVVPESDNYLFELTSDDASRLYINGSLLIDNDGNHGPTLKSGVKLLERGIYAFRLDYAQAGGGDQALILKVNGQSIESKFYYR